MNGRPENLQALCDLCRAQEDLKKTVNGLAVLEVDSFQKVRGQLGLEGMNRLMDRLEEALRRQEDENTFAVRLGSMTFAVAMHRLPDEAALREKCGRIHESLRGASFMGVRYTMSLGAARCAHEPENGGYRCALDQAVKALAEAQALGDQVVVHADTRMPRKTGVLVVEDQQLAAQLLETVVRSSQRYELVESIRSADAAYFYCAQGRVGLVLMDVLTMMGASGLAASARIKRAFPRIKIIVVTSMPEVSWLTRAREAGVDSFWYKEVQREPLLEIMDRTMAGESVYPDRTPQVQLGLTSSDELSDRELDILRELTDGATNAEIGDNLHIAQSTVKTYVDRLMDKTGYRSRTELAVRARESGLVIKD